MSATFEYRRRRYKLEKSPMPVIPTTSHPLKGIIMVEGKTKRKGIGGSDSGSSSKSGSRVHSPSRSITGPLDPLSASLTSTPLDPLSMLASEAEENASGGGKPATGLGGAKSTINTVGCDPNDVVNSTATEPWTARRCEILSRFTTSEKLTIVSSFLNNETSPAVRRGSAMAAESASVRERVQSRLEQLDDFEEGSIRETGNLTQQEYVNKINELSRMLRAFWTSGERVRALKIAIQCAKLLNSVSVMKFYPSKFVLVTDLLEDFGSLVFDRLMDKAASSSSIRRTSASPLPANFRPSQVPEAAKETTRNWFYKIASIRELLPRLYVEAALLKNYRYLDPKEISRALLRLKDQARGIADPLVAIYLRAFIARMGVIALGDTGSTGVAHQLVIDRAECLRTAFDDTLMLLKQIERPFCQKAIAAQNIDLATYLTLYSPALDWLIHCLITCSGPTAGPGLCDHVMQQCEISGRSQTLLIHSLLATLPSGYVSERAQRLAGLIVRATADGGVSTSGYPRHLLYQQFGACLVLAPPSNSAVRLAVLQDVWRLVRQLVVPKEYILCADTWVEFIAKHFGRKELNAVLGDVVDHVTPDRSFEELFPQLQSILTKLLAHTRTAADFHALFGSEKFLQFVDLFQKDYMRIQACTAILEVFNRIPGENGADVFTTDDPVVVNTLLYLGRLLHDSLDMLNFSSEGDQWATSALLKAFISRVDFAGATAASGEAVERQLNFFVDCRAAFPNLPHVLAHLALSVNALAMLCHKRVKGHHSSKSAAFVRACIAFSFITIPSLHDASLRIRLYTNTANAALANGCLGQAEACFKLAIGLLRDIGQVSVPAGSTASPPTPQPQHMEALIELTGLIAASLLMAPDNASQGCLSLLKGLLNAVQEGAGMHMAARTQAYLTVLPLLSALQQSDYAYHAGAQSGGSGGLEANDTLYGSDPLFHAELAKINGTLLFEVVAGLPACSLATSYRLIHCLVRFGRLANAASRDYIVNLWMTAERRAMTETGNVEVVRLRRAILERLKRSAAITGSSEEGAGAAALLDTFGAR